MSGCVSSNHHRMTSVKALAFLLLLLFCTVSVSAIFFPDHAGFSDGSRWRDLLYCDLYYLSDT